MGTACVVLVFERDLTSTKLQVGVEDQGNLSNARKENDGREGRGQQEPKPAKGSRRGG